MNVPKNNPDAIDGVLKSVDIKILNYLRVWGVFLTLCLRSLFF
jgi:hypothetical protein